MALQDWVRHDGYINSVPYTTSPGAHREEEFIMLVRDIQFNDVKTGNYNRFKTLYDVALSSSGQHYIHITNNPNPNLIQEPPNLSNIRKKMY